MISVCLATYNGEKFIEEQLSSILIQLDKNDEIIISDDHSTDKTVEIIRKINDTRIRLYYNDERRSVIANFENALKRAQGDIIFLSDQDDVWHRNKVEKVIKELEDVDLVVTNCLFMGKDTLIHRESFFEVFNSRKGFIKNIVKNTYLGNCMAFHSHLLKVALPFPPELFKLEKMYVYHDIWIGLLADILFTVRFIKEPLSYFRRHEGNASPTEDRKKSPNSLLTKIKSRCILLYTLIKRIYYKK
ncbi:glycosyltransferase family 2 protein [Spirosoma fluminis]